jgi:hypothetical protein
MRNVATYEACSAEAVEATDLCSAEGGARLLTSAVLGAGRGY